jgi:hypothetical protein
MTGPQGPARCRWRTVAVAVVVATLAAVIPALPAAAARAVGNGQFGITPAPGSSGTPVTLRIGRSAGITAGNGREGATESLKVAIFSI